MIYHYEFALSSFVVLILFCILSLRRDYLPIRRNRFFRALLGMEGLTLVFDIVSSEMDAHRAILWWGRGSCSASAMSCACTPRPTSS